MKMRKDIVDAKSWDREIIESCPMLYCMASRPMDETCMCWGFECGEGWRIPLESLSKKLEAMNLLVYPKHRVRIQMCQVKEKFSFLHAYFDVVADPSPFVCFKRRTWQKVYDTLRKIDYKLENAGCNVIPNKHKLLYKIARYARKKMFSYCHEMTSEQAAIAEFMHDYANSQVSIATKECESRCEQCGDPIGDKWNPTCTTMGWIKQLCEKCAIEGKHHYYKGEKLYYDGKVVVNNNKKKSAPKVSVKTTNRSK